MKSSWVNGLDKQETIDLTQNYKESLVMRRRLVALLEEKATSSFKLSHAKGGYENPNWAYLQADARGYERALSEIIGMLNDTK